MPPSHSSIPAAKPIRRVMFFGKNMARTRCAPALAEALRAAGLQVCRMNRATLKRRMGRRLADAWIRRRFRSFAPDLVFIWWRDLPLELLREFKQTALTVSWLEEAMLEFPPSEAEYLTTPHLVASSNLAAIARLRELGQTGTTFQMSGFSPTWHRPLGRRAEQRDVGFIGGPGRHGARAQLLEQVSQKFSTDVFARSWGEWQARCPSVTLRGPVRPAGYRRVCGTSRIVLGLNEVNDIPFHFSNRTFLALACGAFHLTRYVPGLEEVFTDGEHLAWFKSDQECLDKIQFYLDRDELRRKIADAGYQRVMKQHRYSHRIERILGILHDGFAADTETARLLQAAEVLLPGQLAQAVGER